MARSLNGSDQYLRQGESPATGTPLTLAAWVYPTRSDRYEDFLGLSVSAANNTGWFLQLRGPDGARAAAVACVQGTFGIAPSDAAFQLDTWQHIAGVFSADDSRRVYLDGQAGQFDSTPLAVSGTDCTTIGAWERLGERIAFFAGHAAEAAVWNAALGESDIAQLAGGDSPLLVRPANLLAYWPLGGKFGENDLDWADGLYPLAAYGSPTWAAHPTIRYPDDEQPSPPGENAATAGEVFTPTAIAGRLRGAGDIVAAGVRVAGALRGSVYR